MPSAEFAQFVTKRINVFCTHTRTVMALEILLFFCCLSLESKPNSLLLFKSVLFLAFFRCSKPTGMCCRRVCIPERNHLIGPLYADSAHIAQALLQRSCRDIAGQDLTINVWYVDLSCVNSHECIKSSLGSWPSFYPCFARWPRRNRHEVLATWGTRERQNRHGFWRFCNKKSFWSYQGWENKSISFAGPRMKRLWKLPISLTWSFNLIWTECTSTAIQRNSRK